MGAQPANPESDLEMATFSLGSSREQRKIQGGFDPWLVVAAIGLIVFGLIAIYSEGTVRPNSTTFQRQSLNIALGLVPFSVFAFVHPKTWLRLANGIYVLNVVLLFAVLLKGQTAKGAERWIDIGPMQFQPSELSKILLVLTLASFFAVRREEINKLSTFLLSFLHVGVPAGLILAQPHLGATLVVLFTWLAICIVAGVPIRFIATFCAIFAVIIGLVVGVPQVRNTVLKPYQAERVAEMFGNVRDKKGKSYQTEQSKIAFGVGGITGVGFRNGERKAGRFIPEQDTDFVFTIIGEEFGLVGCTLVLGLFGLLFMRCWLGIIGEYENYYQTMSAGVLTVFAAHTFANLGMVLEMVPVVGLWLPFMSRGGTAIWLCMSLVGLMLNIRSREKSVLFNVQH